MYIYVHCIVCQGQGTIKPYAAFNAEHDAQLLRKAMKGLGKCSCDFQRYS